LTSRYYVRSIPTGVLLRAGFDSGRAIVETERLGRACCWGSLLFYFCQLIPPVSLLVFLLVSAAIGG
jgi:hypothetical protein